MVGLHFDIYLFLVPHLTPTQPNPPHVCICIEVFQTCIEKSIKMFFNEIIFYLKENSNIRFSIKIKRVLLHFKVKLHCSVILPSFL